MILSRIFVIGASCLLVLACGGGGGGSPSPSPSPSPSNATSPSTSSNTVSQNVLFVADPAHGVIGAFPVLDATPSTVVAGTVLTGIPDLGQSMAYDAKTDQLYATSVGSVVVFQNASKASGAVTPSRTISTKDMLTLGPSTMYLDRKGDVLYVGDKNGVAVINHASTANGLVVPDRVLKLGFDVGSFGTFFTVDTSRSILYVSKWYSVYIFPFGTNTSINGDLPYLAHSFSGPGASAFGLAIDTARDRLYVANTSNGVDVYNNASKGFGAFSGRIGLTSAQYLTLDEANDRLYVGSFGKAFILNHASTVNGGSASPISALARVDSGVAGFAFP